MNTTANQAYDQAKTDIVIEIAKLQKHLQNHNMIVEVKKEANWALVGDLNQVIQQLKEINETFTGY